MKKLNNKGFSLVELIIVIAIMVILVVAVAPQYLKHVNNSKISTDVQTAAEMATAINVAVADGSYTTVLASFTGTNAPESKLGGTWTINSDPNTGVAYINLTVASTPYQCYPNPDNSTNGINNETVGLKK